MDSVDKMTMIPVFDSVEQPFLPVSVQLPGMIIMTNGLENDAHAFGFQKLSSSVSPPIRIPFALGYPRDSSAHQAIIVCELINILGDTEVSRDVTVNRSLVSSPQILLYPLDLKAGHGIWKIWIIHWSELLWCSPISQIHFTIILIMNRTLLICTIYCVLF